MPTSYTSLLGLALPVTGELSGTWGDEVNNYITSYLDAAIAGTQTISGAQVAVTLSKTTGSSLTSAGSGATGSSQYQIIVCSGNPASLLTITAPAASKAYLILNRTSTNQSVKIVGVGPTTGVTIAANRAALVAWNGSDFQLVATTDVAQLSGLGTGVANALAVNVGTAGSFVVNGGALGTPSSGTLTNATGLPISTGVSGLGTNVATALGTNVGTAGSVVVNGGALGTPSSGTLTNATGLPIVAGTTGTLTVARGGTGTTTTPSNGQLLIGNGSGYTVANLTQGTGVSISNSAGGITISATGTGGTVTSVSGTGSGNGISLSGTVTSSGSITLAGTNYTANNVLLGNGTSAFQTVAPGTSGNVLTSNGTTWTSAALPAGGLTYVYKTANYTTVDKEGVLADTSGGSFTVTLPAAPATGAQVVVADAGSSWGTNNLTVGRNGSTIGGLAENLVCDITGASVQFVYDGTTWEVYAQIGGNGGNAVTLNGVQTLTNKTLTTPVITASTQLINTNTTAVRSVTYVLTASLTLTLPAAPAVGDVVGFANASGTTTAVIARNGSNIMGLAEDMTLDNAQARGTLIFVGGARGWELVN